jgi:hypothetical protein
MIRFDKYSNTCVYIIISLKCVIQVVFQIQVHIYMTAHYHVLVQELQ